MPTEDAVRAVPPGNGEVRIYHNPRCSKSRATLELIRAQGIEPQVVRYLETPPTRAELEALLDCLEGDLADVVRTKEAAFKSRDVDLTSRADVIDAILENPILMERPIVVSDLGARIGRPPERVLDVVPAAQRDA